MTYSLQWGQAEVTIPYLECNRKLHLNFEIGEIFEEFGGLFVPKRRKNGVSMRKLGLVAFQ